MVTVDEFKAAVQKVCVGKTYDQFPDALKAFVSKIFDSIDLNGKRNTGQVNQMRCLDGVTDISRGWRDMVLTAI